MAKRLGRPPKTGNDAMESRLEIRVSQAEKEAYADAADSAGVDRSDWIRNTLNAAALRILQGRKPD
jgi:uncharacterized protein (DUF1778 family)